MHGTLSKKTELPERVKNPRTYRRIVTGNVNGRAVVQSDEPLPAYEFRTVPGYEHTLIWVNAATPDLSKEQRFDRYPDSVVPGPGGTRAPALRNVSTRFTSLRGSIFSMARPLETKQIGSPEGISRPLRKRKILGDAPNEHRGLLGCLRRRRFGWSWTTARPCI